MPISTVPATTTADSRAARKARMLKIASGAIKAGGLPLGDYFAVVKTATVYHNPGTNKDSYRCEVEITQGEYEGQATTVFTSVANDDRAVEMIKALGLGEEAIDMHLDQQYDELLYAMQGHACRITRVPKDDKKPDENDNRTNNWAKPTA
jgi:hypothetical protein